MSNYNVSYPLQQSEMEDDQDTVATPEGDNEFSPDQPLPSDDPTPERPRGNEPHPAQPIRPAQE